MLEFARIIFLSKSPIYPSSEYKFKKQVSTKVHVHDTDVIIIGSLWELGFSDNIDESVQIFALDCGLGERNSLGFGFVNEVKYL